MMRNPMMLSRREVALENAARGLEAARRAEHRRAVEANAALREERRRAEEAYRQAQQMAAALERAELARRADQSTGARCARAA